MRSNPVHQLFFILQLEKILRSNLNFSTSYSRSFDLKSRLGLLFVSFIWLAEKNFTEIFTYRLMSKLVKSILNFYDWFLIYLFYIIQSVLYRFDPRMIYFYSPHKLYFI